MSVTPGKGKAQPSKSESVAPTAQPVSGQYRNCCVLCRWEVGVGVTGRLPSSGSGSPDSPASPSRAKCLLKARGGQPASRPCAPCCHGSTASGRQKGRAASSACAEMALPVSGPRPSPPAFASREPQAAPSPQTPPASRPSKDVWGNPTLSDGCSLEPPHPAQEPPLLCHLHRPSPQAAQVLPDWEGKKLCLALDPDSLRPPPRP